MMIKRELQNATECIENILSTKSLCGLQYVLCLLSDVSVVNRTVNKSSLRVSIAQSAWKIILLQTNS